MHKLPGFMMMLCAYFGGAVVSRNQTELKDNLIRATVEQSAFFCGDIVFGSIFERLCDKF